MRVRVARAAALGLLLASSVAATAAPLTEPPPEAAAPPVPPVTAPPPPAAAAPLAPAPPARPMLSGTLKAELRGAFIVNLAYNQGTLYPGSFAYFALPRAVSAPQFLISPANTVVGFKLSGLTFGSAQITGALDVNLRSPSPLITANTLAPQFYDVHMQLEFDRWRLIVGQYPDVILPLVPDTINSYPAGYVPGAMGYVHPQVRAELRLPVGEGFQGIGQVSINRPVQTFELADGIVGRQAGIPDVQGRLAFAAGRSDKPWQRPMELGITGHIGRRRITVVENAQDRDFGTWSVAADLRLRLPWAMLIKARIWRGRLLGDFVAGIFQTVDTMTFVAIPAAGMWFELQQSINDRWRVTAIYGRDDPDDAYLSPGNRSLNQEALLNLLWDVTKTIGFGAEVSRWATSYLGAPTTRVWRGDLLFFLRF